MFEQERIRRNCADVSLHSLKQQTCKNECITEAFSSRRETAAFPAQYVVSPWCTDPHAEGQQIVQKIGGNIERKKKDRDLSFGFMFPFGLLRGPQRVLSSSPRLSTPVTRTHTASSSDSFKMHALQPVLLPFGFRTVLALFFWIFFMFAFSKSLC